MSIETILNVAEIQRFCMHDGPGIRTTIFLKGCPLRCAWCHNPETQSAENELLFYESKCISCGACLICPMSVHSLSPQRHLQRARCVGCGACAEACPAKALEICGHVYAPEELAQLVARDVAFYGKEGGVTLSGGEPFLQGEAAIALLRSCREKGFSTAVETCGYADPKIIAEAVPLVDLFLWDIKDTNEERHLRYTDVSNERILRNLKMADELGAKTRLRCILVNGVNTEEAHYRRVADLAASLDRCEGVEWLPYHAYSGTKAVFVGHSDNGRREWIPTEEQLAQARSITDGMRK